MSFSEFAEYPEIRLALRRLQFFLAIWERDLALLADAEADAETLAVGALNAITKFRLRLEVTTLVATGVAKDVAVRTAYAKVRASLERIWPCRYLDPAEERAIVTRLAYESELRLSASGPKDSRMESARMVAALFEGLNGHDPDAAIRKSLQRLRRKLRGKKWIRFDFDTLTAHCIDAEDETFGDLPREAGRPKTSRRQTED